MVLRSLSKAEYHSMTMEITELVWSKSLVASFGFLQKWAMKLLYDCQAAIHILNFHGRTKHVEIGYHFVQEKL